MWRSLKFVKYLPNYGWRPVVLTIRGQKYYIDRLDYTMLKEIPESTRVYRTNMFHPLSMLNFVISVLRLHGNRIQRNLEESKNIKDRNISANSSLKRHLLDIVTTPDRYSGWLPFAIKEGARIILKEKPDVIFSTSPPIVSHIIAMVLKYSFSIPWIADFRDPWTATMNSVTKFKRGVNIYLEREVIKMADTIIANTDQLKQRFIDVYRDSVYMGKFATLTNGYDPSDLKLFRSSDNDKSGRFVITHTGEFYEELRRPDEFMISLSQLIRENALPSSDIQVNFVGAGSYTSSMHFKTLLSDLGLTKVLNIIDFVTHRECIGYLHNSTVLLLLQTSPNTNLQIPAKAFEYIGIGKPILAITPNDGATAELIRNTGTGVVTKSNDLNTIKQGILGLYRAYKRDDLGKYRNQKAQIDYTREELTKVLAMLINGVVSGSTDPKYAHKMKMG